MSQEKFDPEAAIRGKVCILDLKRKPGEKQVSASFSKCTGPESRDGSIGVRLKCRGGAVAVTKLIDELNRAIPGDEA